MEIDGQPYANAMDCRLIQKARQQSDLICNPIFDWSFRDVWDFIHDRSISYNPLYDPPYNYTRVGCVGCPLGNRRNQLKEFADFPAYRKLYVNAFQRMIEVRIKAGKPTKWKSGEEVMDWWLGDNNIPGQISIADYLEGETK